VQDFIIPILVGIIVVVVGLYLEYQTGWFANRVPKSMTQMPDSADGGRSFLVTVKTGLSQLYDLPSEYVIIHSIGRSLFGLGKDIRLEITVYRLIDRTKLRASRQSVSSEDVVHLEESYFVWADDNGRILRTRRKPKIRRRY